MAPQTSTTDAALVRLLSDPHYEVFPVPGVEKDLVAYLEPDVVVHVMSPPAADGTDRSVDAACRIARAGFQAMPHIAARCVRDRSHLEQLLARASEAGIKHGFFPGGDLDSPIGEYESAVALLRDLALVPHSLTEIGVAAYPEGHRAIPDETLIAALLDKQRVATFMSSENCLDPDRLLAWLDEMRAARVELPLRVGVPGVVPVRRLADALREYGLKSALRYLRHQHGMIASVLRRRFTPDEVVDGVASRASEAELGIQGLHLFTFQEVAATERWRTNYLRRLGDLGPSVVT
jgi:methylenetetrahydrofolate reductase (NADPH)